MGSLGRMSVSPGTAALGGVMCVPDCSLVLHSRSKHPPTTHWNIKSYFPVTVNLGRTDCSREHMSVRETVQCYAGTSGWGKEFSLLSPGDLTR